MQAAGSPLSPLLYARPPTRLGRLGRLRGRGHAPMELAGVLLTRHSTGRAAEGEEEGRHGMTGLQVGLTRA